MKKLKKLSDLQFDEANLNQHTMRGLAVLEDSLRTCGAGRSVLADKHGRLIAGNGTVEVAMGMGIEDHDIIVVPTDGKKLVVVQRTDLDLACDPEARKLSIADNRSSEVGLQWDGAALAALYASGEAGDLSGLFRSDEIQALCESVALPEDEELSPGKGKDATEAPGSRWELTLQFRSAQELKAAANKLLAEGYEIKRNHGKEVL